MWKGTKIHFSHKLYQVHFQELPLKSFPNPLPPAEENRYMQRYLEGDEEARNILIEHNLRLVTHVLKKYHFPESEQEDMISIGTIGLIKSVMTFNPRKGNRLATYAARCIENEILMHLRSRKKFSREVSLYESIGTDNEGNEIQLYDILKAEEPALYEQVHLKEDISNLYRYFESSLDEREKQILRLRYGLFGSDTMTQREIASLMGISRSYVSRIEKKAIQTLQQQF
jgi:RNA polymerase sporulation-specific sigma factor